MGLAILRLLAVPSALADDKNGVAPGAISLPKGPGSIEGLGESFQPALNTGTARYSIGLKPPPGAAGQAPPLKLDYEGGSGNGPVGYGWNLPMAYVQRRSDHGIPTYGDYVGFPRQDSFINEMREELVPQTNGYFFCQDEGAFIRYQPVGDHWEATSPEGTRLEFGSSANGRVQDGTNGHVFSWLLEQATDTHGNTIIYSYSGFADDTNLNQRYLTTIRYGPGAPPWINYHFVSFEYEDRPDWFEDCRSGFIVRTGKRLKTIRMGTQGVVLPGHLQGDFDGDGNLDCLDRAYRLEYSDYAGTNSHWSLLAKVTPIGADGVSSLPASSFGYAVSDPSDLVSAAGHIIGGTNEPPAVMDDPLVELVDLNGDGLPDILKTEQGGGEQQAYINRGEVQLDTGKAILWDSPVDVDPGSGTAWNYDLSSSDTHLADMDGDGLADLVHKSAAGDVFYFRNLGRMAWGERQMMSVQDTAPPSPFGDVGVRTADLDFDKRMDIIQSVSSGNGYAYRIWFNLGDQTYSPSITVEPDTAFSLADPTVQIADCNGDRVADIARVQPNGVVVTAGLGYGRFAAPMTMWLPDTTLSDSQVSRAKLTDLNGDGLADLVIERAVPGECWYWLNLGNYTFSPRKVITGLPTGLGVNAVTRWADINGNGTTDLVYADQYSIPRIQSVDLVEVLGGGLTPNMLTAISNGIGRITVIGYAPSTSFALADAAAGQPWSNAVPLAVSVVAGVTNLDSLGHQYVTLFHYHDGYYDPVEKQFRGFGRAEQVTVGDASAPTLVTRSYFDTGNQFEAMKGKLLRLTTEQEDGEVFQDVTTTWTIPPVVLMTGTNGTNVSFAHPVDSQTEVLELGHGTPRTLESEMSYDNYGNRTRLADYGIVDNGDRSAFDDERVTVTEYALNTNAWILRHPARQQIQDENGAVISRREYYYDDESFSGANFGQIVVGNLTLTRAWISSSSSTAYIQALRTKYDTYGNAITSLDPLAVAPAGAVDFTQGHIRQVAYDEPFHTYPVQETINMGNGSADLVFQASYDQGLGTTTRSLDFNQNQTSYGYDVFGRLTQVIQPGDTPDYPTSEYDYFLAVPFGTTGLVNYVETRRLDKMPGAVGPNQRDYYVISRTFTDGLGRTLMSKQEAEPALGSSAPRVVVSGATLFNARLKPSRTLNPFFTLKSGSTLDELLDYESIEDPAWQGAFHESGQLVDLDLAAAEQTSMSYDATLRTAQVTNPDGTSRSTVYEPLVTRSFDENDTDPASAYYNTPTVQFSDGLGRVIRTDETTRLNDDGTPATGLKTWTTLFEYDLNDRLTRITDSQNNVKTLVYDGLKRKTFMNDPDSGMASYTYDDASNLKETIDAKGQRTTYTYDGANRILTEDYHDEGQRFSANFAYDPTQPLSPANRPDVAYFYDTPVSGLPMGDGTTATAQNAKGALAYVWDLAGEEHTSYDARGRIAWTVKRIPDPALASTVSPQPPATGLVSYRTSFQYDSLDRLTTLVYPDNDQVSYQYNDRGLLERIVGGPSGSILSDLVYAPSAQQEQIDYGNGVRTTYAYDKRQRLTSLLTVSQPSTLNQQLLDFSYTFDGVSNLKAIEDQREASAIPPSDTRRNSQAFSYDDLYRLTRVQYNLPNPSSGNGGEIDYRYDRIGNMLSQTSDIQQIENGFSVTQLGALGYGGTAGPSGRAGRNPGDPPGPHALAAVSQLATNNPQPRLYGYDANGNMTNIDGLQCTWDFKNRLVALEDDTLRAQYTYDYTDRRITKLIAYKPGASTNITQGASRLTTLYVGKHFEVRDHDQPTKYVFNGSTRVAGVIGSLSASARLQRLRLWPGWNLLSVAVTAPDLAGQFEQNSPGLVQLIYQWDPSSGSYSAVSPGQTVSTGAVLWVKAVANATIGIVGAYAEPSIPHVQTGGSYLAGTGLEAWTPVFPPNCPQWSYDSQSGQWNVELAGDLAFLSGPPWTIAPGQAVYVKASAPADLAIPDPVLRVRYYHQDHLGSSSVITDANGEVVEESAFYPFGLARNEFQPRQSHEPYQFTQKERDRESGLHCLEARFLAGALARFVTADTKYANPESLSAGELGSFLANPQMANVYAYGLGNPLRYTDPTGLGPWSWFRENVWIPGVDSTSELDVGRTLKVAGGAALALSTGGGSLVVQAGVLLVASDQIVSGVTGNESLVHKGGKALCGGNETCGTVAEVALTMGAGGYNAAARLSAARLSASGVAAADAAADTGIIRAGAARTYGGEVQGGGGVMATTAVPAGLEATAPAAVSANAATFASESGVACRAASAANAELDTFYGIMQEQQAALRSSGMQSGSALVDKAFENADAVWRSTYGTEPPGKL